MSSQSRPIIEYSKLGNIVAYTGRHGSGKTLAAVVHIIEGKVSPLFSNIDLRGIESMRMRPDSILAAIEAGILDGCTILLDDLQVVTSATSEYDWYKVFLTSRKRNLRFILTSPDLMYLSRCTVACITNGIFTKFTMKASGEAYLHLIEVGNGDVTVYNKIKANKYFGYYDTLSIYERFL